MRNLLLSALAVAVVALIGVVVYADSEKGKDEKKVKGQETCPIMGGKITKDMYVDYKGYRIYFCCGGCPDAFRSDPEKWLKKMLDEGVTLDKAPHKAQETCIVSGKKINKEIYADVKGYRVYFDSADSKEKFMKDVDAWLVKLWLTGVTPLETPKETKPQTICPVMKAKINKNLFLDYKGYRIYVCCGACIKAIKADPEKWLKAVLESGVTPEKAPDKPQTKCPVSGKDIDKKVYVDYDGYRIYFDTAESKEKFVNDPKQYYTNMLLTGVTPEPAPKAEKTDKDVDMAPVVPENDKSFCPLNGSCG
ncbi:MAG: hypothetical protein Kow00107_00410 [Planctomycetota bacterium]